MPIRRPIIGATFVISRTTACRWRKNWLSSAELRAELVQMMRDRLAQNVVGPGDVDLFCSLNKNGELNDQLDGFPVLPAGANAVGRAAVLACLGSQKGRARVLRALTST